MAVENMEAIGLPRATGTDILTYPSMCAGAASP